MPHSKEKVDVKVRLPGRLVDEIDEWLDGLEPKPSRTSVIAALVADGMRKKRDAVRARLYRQRLANQKS